MTSLCFVLVEDRLSYIYAGTFQVEDGVTPDSVIQDAKELTSASNGWGLAGVEISLYQVFSSPTFSDPF